MQYFKLSQSRPISIINFSWLTTWTGAWRDSLEMNFLHVTFYTMLPFSIAHRLHNEPHKCFQCRKCFHVFLSTDVQVNKKQVLISFLTIFCVLLIRGDNFVTHFTSRDVINSRNFKPRLQINFCHQRLLLKTSNHVCISCKRDRYNRTGFVCSAISIFRINFSLKFVDRDSSTLSGSRSFRA